MQVMEQIRYIPAPTMGFAWSSASVGKTLFALITALCILIGLVGGREDVSTDLLLNQSLVAPVSSNRWPIEVSLLTPTVNSIRSSISGIPVPAGKRPLDAANRVSMDQSGRSTSGKVSSDVNGSMTSNLRLSAATPENASEPLTFSGRVVDSEGKPVGDAEILHTGKSNSPEPVTHTAEDGTFHFKMSRPKPRALYKELEILGIVATHPDFAVGWRNVPPQNMGGVEIRLKNPAVISGKTVDKVGNAIQNAVVRIEYLFSDNDPMSLRHGDYLWIDVIPPANTNADGEFVLYGLPQGGVADLDIQASGYAKERFNVQIESKGIEFQLKRGARIEGHFSYALTGMPVTDATIGFARMSSPDGWGQAKVDGHGNYLLKDLGPGVYSLYLDKGPEGWTAASNRLIEIDEGQTVSGIDLTLVRGGLITGRVIDRDSNEPIVNHHIFSQDAARPETGRSSHVRQTDESGTYRFRAAPGPAQVTVYPPQGYRDYLSLGVIRKDVTIVQGETVTIDFHFSKGTELRGQILTKTGEPVSGARVTDQWELSDFGKSNEFGEFTAGGQKLGKKLGLKAEHNALRLRGTAEVEVQPGTSVNIEMERYEQVKVSGRVVNGEGEPIPLVNVGSTNWHPIWGHGNSSPIAATDINGWYREVVLIVGDEYTISANLDGYREAETGRFTATVEMTQIADLVLTPIDARFFIEGRVTDTTGKPVSSARVYTNQQPFRQAITGEDGGYRFEDLSTTVITELVIDHPEYAEHRFEILKANGRHDLVLVKADGYLAGRVVDADGKPIAQATMTAKGDEEFSGYYWSKTHTSALGEFELKHIKDPIVSIHVGVDHDFKVFRDIAVNQRELVLTLMRTESSTAATSEQQLRKSSADEAEDRLKTLLGKTAPELAVAKWLSGAPVSVGSLKGSTVALFFWDLRDSERVQWARLLNLLGEVYREKGLVCAAICPAKTEIEMIKQLIAEHSLTYSVGLDSPTNILGARGETFDRYAVGWEARIVLVNAAGEIAGRVWDRELENQIQILLAD